MLVKQTQNSYLLRIILVFEKESCWDPSSCSIWCLRRLKISLEEVKGTPQLYTGSGNVN